MRRIAFALVLAIAAVASTATAQQSEVEVRIVAQRLDDGRVEFALQQRDGDSWGPRILPTRRFFPVSSRGRWLHSSAISLAVAAPAPAASPAAPLDPFVVLVDLWDGVTFLDEMNDVDRNASPAAQAAAFFGIQERAHDYSVRLLGLVPAFAPYGAACEAAISDMSEVARMDGFVAAYYSLIYEGWPHVDYFDVVKAYRDAAKAASDRYFDNAWECRNDNPLPTPPGRGT
ncbi:MAG: hypothetical protein F4X25_04835 [Chloroflexi bacterium]|nr:hypothetical protein [Chloroflexota bacterium]